jgi:hypothetical protein
MFKITRCDGYSGGASVNDHTYSRPVRLTEDADAEYTAKTIHDDDLYFMIP